MNIVIIEDEYKSALELAKIIKEINPEFHIAAILPSISESLAWFKNNPEPDLIISDIQLSDGISFEIFKNIELKVPIIFSTAYSKYAIQAFENYSIDYILKPVEKSRLVYSFEKIRLLKERLTLNNEDYLNRLAGLLKSKNPSSRSSLLAYFRDEIIPIEINNIDLVTVEYDRVIVNLKNQKFEIKETMDNLMEFLDPQQFFRSNRQSIVNRKFIKNIQHSTGRKLCVSLLNKETLIISKLKANKFLEWVQGAVHA